MLVGLNTIREICARCSLAMDEDLLHDLAKYKSYRDKSVSSSAQSLIQLFREKNPQLLERKDRGKPTEFQRNLQPITYAQSNPALFIEGAEILDSKQENPSSDQDDEDEEDEEEDEGEEEEEEAGWVNVSDDDDDEENNDDENEENGKDEKEKELTEEERREKAIAISSERILTQKEFEQLKVIQMKRKIQDRRKNRFEENLTKTKKRKTISIDTDSDSDDEQSKQQNNSNFISLKEIEKVQKKRAHDKESRLETVLAGREGRAKFGKWKKEKGRVGTTNKEKLKTKNFQMVKAKHRQKQKRSFREKQIALRDALLKDKRLR